MTRLLEKLRAVAMPLAILGLTALATSYAAAADGYAPFVLALVALTAVVGVGLNILVGLTGQVWWVWALLRFVPPIDWPP